METAQKSRVGLVEVLSIPQRRQLFDLRKRVIRLRQGLLHNVLAVDDRSGHPRAVAMQVRARLGLQAQGNAASHRAMPRRGGRTPSSTILGAERNEAEVALHAERHASRVARIGEDRYDVVADLARRHRRAETGEEGFEADALAL